MRLTDLDPELEDSSLASAAQTLTFLCPLCRKRRIRVDIWSGPAGEVQGLPNADGERPTIRIWHAEQGPERDWDTLSLTPSIDHQHGNPRPERPCVGWHGFITNGAVM